MRHALSAIVLAVALVSSPAEAAGAIPVPPHDVDRACATLNDRAMIANCVRDEQYRYDYISSVWSSLSPERQREAFEFSRNQGATYYAFYKSLSLFVSTQVQMQQRADDAAGPTPQFQR